VAAVPIRGTRWARHLAKYIRQ